MIRERMKKATLTLIALTLAVAFSAAPQAPPAHMHRVVLQINVDGPIPGISSSGISRIFRRHLEPATSR